MALENASTAGLAAALSEIATGATKSPSHGQPQKHSTSSGPSLRCAVCNKTGATLCDVCGSAAYCSRVCKNDDAKYHRSVCPAFKAFLNAGRPKADARLALFFSEEPFQPALIWVIEQGYKLKKVEQLSGNLSYSGILGPNESGSFVPITTNLEHKFPLDHTVTVYHRSNFFWDDRSQTNLAIFEFTQGEHKFDWRGPIAVFSRNGIANASGLRDITLADLRSFQNFLVNYGEGLEKSHRYGGLRIVELWDPALWEGIMLRFMSKDAKMVKGVKISCLGDMKVLGKKQYTSTAIPPNHPIFFNENEGEDLDEPPAPTQISVRMDVPLLIRRCALDLEWKGRYTNAQDFARALDPTNEPAALLTTIVDVGSKLWGCNKDHENINSMYVSGSVIIVRQDKKDISVEQVRALADYIKQHVKPAIEKQKAQELKLNKEQIREVVLPGRALIVNRLKLDVGIVNIHSDTAIILINFLTPLLVSQYSVTQVHPFPGQASGNARRLKTLLPRGLQQGRTSNRETCPTSNE
ncbi:hypothetical protein BDZ45DRAFT_787734 [Acephala macrosclerotiorum]|nr:hypothetical protein BDZ45DRAFT_787734 [Acephala macrosclerotiorum]